MSKSKILVQLDSDPHASVFDGVVAVDSGVDQLFRHPSVQPSQVRELVHGAIFTRGVKDLSRTAIFVGGSDVAAGEALLAAVQESFFGPMRVSVMLDSNGANTTAAAAVLAAAKHVDLGNATAVVLGATGPVGRRAVHLLAGQGAQVFVGSRSEQKAASACESVKAKLSDAVLTPFASSSESEIASALQAAQVVIAAGAAGVTLLSGSLWQAHRQLQVAIDLNAVPPLGIEGVEVMDQAAERSGVVCYGAIGVGGNKMKIHKAALQRLFESNDQVLDVDEIFALGKSLAEG